MLPEVRLTVPLGGELTVIRWGAGQRSDLQGLSILPLVRWVSSLCRNSYILKLCAYDMCAFLDALLHSNENLNENFTLAKFFFKGKRKNLLACQTTLWGEGHPSEARKELMASTLRTICVTESIKEISIAKIREGPYVGLGELRAPLRERSGHFPTLKMPGGGGGGGETLNPERA